MAFRLCLLFAIVAGCFSPANPPTSTVSAVTGGVLVSYAKTGTRKLQFVNNPEQIYPADLGDSGQGNKRILVSTAPPGQYRNVFEHVNRIGLVIGYGIQVYNPNATPITIITHGDGFIANSYGAIAFTTMLNNYSTSGVSTVVPAASVLWIMRKDGGVPVGNFFSGVIDYDVQGGTVEVNNVAYLNLANYDGTAAYEGYVQRIEPDGTNEALVYKGTSDFTESVATRLNFTISNADPAGTSFPVVTSEYDLLTQSYGPAVTHLDPVSGDFGWRSHIGPSQNAQAVTNDVHSFSMPGWAPLIDPLTQSDGTGNYPNLGNWSVVYSVSGSVTNTGNRSRTVQLRVREAPGANCDGTISYLSGSVWATKAPLAAGERFVYRTFSVPKNSTRAFTGKFVLGTPACGALFQSISLGN